MINSIKDAIILYLPTIMTIIMQITIVTGLLSKFKALINAVKKDNRVEKLQETLNKITEENYELKKQMKECIEVITKIKRGE